MRRELPAGARLAAFGGVLVAAFGAAYGVGTAAGPARPADAAPAAHPVPAGPAPAEGTAGGHEAGHAEGAAPQAAAPLPGLAVSQAGYALRPAATTLPSGRSVPFAFTVTGPDGLPLTAYDPTHERDLHLVVVRRDLASFQHLHPRLAADGTWTADLDLADAGTYRAFADFAPEGGAGLTLGTDLFVGGDFRPAPLPQPARTARVDELEVTLDGDPRPGVASRLVFTVARDGRRPVTDLQPHLGAFGHLVALRVGDLAYLHTHPAEEARAGDTGGPQVEFATTFPAAGRYRLHLEVRVDGRVRTAAFTVVVPDAPHGSEPDAVPPGAHDATPHGH